MITVNEISGFCSKAPVNIFDSHGRPFYVKQKSKDLNGVIFFNLPPGKYITENVLSRLPRPLKYICKPLPKPEFKRFLPELKVLIEPNPRKCSIYFNTGIIKLDPEYANKPLPNLCHILFHELGHFLYISEWKADLFSCYNMLKFGFNPSQCLLIMMHNLSSDKKATIDRANRNANYLSHVKFIL